MFPPSSPLSPLRGEGPGVRGSVRGSQAPAFSSSLLPQSASSTSSAHAARHSPQSAPPDSPDPQENHRAHDPVAARRQRSARLRRFRGSASARRNKSRPYKEESDTRG